MVTRGVYSDELVNSKLWLRGPDFLVADAKYSTDVSSLNQEEVSEINFDSVNDTNLFVTNVNNVKIIPIERFSIFTKVNRVVAG